MVQMRVQPGQLVVSDGTKNFNILQAVSVFNVKPQGLLSFVCMVLYILRVRLWLEISIRSLWPNGK